MAEDVSTKLRCCICGNDTADAVDYLLLKLTSLYSRGEQFLGAHAACLNAILAEGFRAEVHLM